MSLELRFFATFREAVGTKTISREYDAATVGDVLVALESEFEGLAGQILEDGAVQPQVNVLLNGRDVTHEQGIDTPVDGDETMSIFPPVAGGAAGDERVSDAAIRREKSYRGISLRLAREYLVKLGGEAAADDRVEAADWAASLSAEKVSIGPTLSLTEVTVVFEGKEGALGSLIEKFSRKAMRAGG